MAAKHVSDIGGGRCEVAPDLRAEVAALMAACRTICPRLAMQAVSRDPDVAHSIGAAICNGERLMIAFDVDSPDPLLRVMSIGADQVATQHVAFGAIAPSERRN
ncbi:hypothetical protein [uncultured Xanthomonas sp.]|uniref:hypothetical protein n=1 Tax=uncultured Xanthomonas sp. TaxID=152831 RepID=UPI0025FD7219|nr:hypothetical protein [uncultured Xanthomonas sp.]